MTGLIAYNIALLIALIVSGLFLYGLFTVRIRHRRKEQGVGLKETYSLARDVANPLLTPGSNGWESGGVMNPAVVTAGGRTHLFYRAVGNDGVSRIGYASSANGSIFDERFPYPVFALASETNPRWPARYPGLTASGGSFAGTEDPRAVIIGDRMHLSFSAFADWNSLRIGVTSISVEDLIAKRWRWTPPTFLSPKGQVHKNWVIFPEKIQGAFAILHSLHAGSRDRVLIDYVDTLDEASIESLYQPTQDNRVWDSTLRGAGPPPIRTDQGWLLLYHATDARQPHRYKLGALMLDLENPSRIIGRAPVPILEPDAHYENDGAKEGVVYACGMVRTGDRLRVYYGGSDSVVCAAETSLSRLLRKLTPVAGLIPSPN